VIKPLKSGDALRPRSKSLCFDGVPVWWLVKLYLSTLQANAVETKRYTNSRLLYFTSLFTRHLQEVPVDFNESSFYIRRITKS